MREVWGVGWWRAPFTSLHMDAQRGTDQRTFDNLYDPSILPTPHTPLPQERGQLKSFKGSADYPLLQKAHELAEPIAKGVRARGCSPDTAALMWLAAIARGARPCRGGWEQVEGRGM
jgi:hypothetical protein